MILRHSRTTARNYTRIAGRIIRPSKARVQIWLKRGCVWKWWIPWDTLEMAILMGLWLQHRRQEKVLHRVTTVPLGPFATSYGIYWQSWPIMAGRNVSRRSSAGSRSVVLTAGRQGDIGRPEPKKLWSATSPIQTSPALATDGSSLTGFSLRVAFTSPSSEGEAAFLAKSVRKRHGSTFLTFLHLFRMGTDLVSHGKWMFIPPIWYLEILAHSHIRRKDIYHNEEKKASALVPSLSPRPSMCVSQNLGTLWNNGNAKSSSSSFSSSQSFF